MVVSTAASQVYLRLWVRVSDVQQDGLIPVLSVQRVPKTASPHDDVHPQVPAGSERFADFHSLCRTPSHLNVREIA